MNTALLVLLLVINLFLVIIARNTALIGSLMSKEYELMKREPKKRTKKPLETTNQTS